MTRTQNLLIIQQHLKDSIESHRQKLSAMWETGKRAGDFLFDKMNEQYELMQDKLLRCENEICPHPKDNLKKLP